MDGIQEKRNRPKLQNINGLPFTTVFSDKYLLQTVSFKPRTGDIFIAGFPKSGTTWTQYIVWDIVNEGAPLPDVNKIMHIEVPHLEMVGTDGLDMLKSPRLLKVNLPFNFTPYDSSAKYIYVFRNPWDCCVSAFHHFKQVDATFEDCTFDEYFEAFIKGEVSHGDYFDHLLSWYAHWKDPNFLFIAYEEMNRNTRNTIIKIARFMGEKYYDVLMKKDGTFERILQHVQFENMKQNCSAARTKHSNNVQSEDEVIFFRSGTIGQWKGYFTEDQKERLKHKFIQKLGGTQLLKLWQKSDIFLD